MSPTIFFFIFIFAERAIVCITAAPPDISIFMPRSDEEGLRFIPPVSKVTPLPTSTIGLSFFPPPRYSKTINFDSSSDPRPTESIACIFFFSISFSPRTVTFTGSFFTASFAFRAKIEGVMSPPGIFASVLTLFTSCATAWPFKISFSIFAFVPEIIISLIKEKPSFVGVL